MSGPENIRGLDYQISYSLLRVLEAIRDEQSNVAAIQFESLSENEEDLNIIGVNGAKEFIQIKKKSEGYNWTPSELKGILEKFHDKDGENVSFAFVTDAGGNVSVRDLKLALLEGGPVGNSILLPFVTDSMGISDLREVLSKTSILTHSYTSNNDEDPASMVRERIYQTLLRSPYYLKKPVSEAYDGLWRYIFNSARVAATITVEEIVNSFSMLGVELLPRTWMMLQDLSSFSGRDLELNEISQRINDHRTVFVQGISGIGKTFVLGRIAQRFAESQRNVCWIGVNQLTAKSEIISIVTACLKSVGFTHDSEYLATAEEAYKESRLVDVLRRTELYVFIDSVDSSNHEVSRFIEVVLSLSLSQPLLGGLILSSTLLPEEWAPLLSGEQITYELTGFTEEDTGVILSDSNISVSDEQLEKFHEAVGGHPMSLVFLKQLSKENLISDDDFDELKQKSIENTRDWLFKKIYLQLDPPEQNLLLTASVFNYPFHESEIEPLIESRIKPKYLFDGLIRKNVMLADSGSYFVHDSIRPLIYNMLREAERDALHDKLAVFYKSIIDKYPVATGGAPYALIFRWGYHIEHIQQGESLTENYKVVLELKDSYLDALWAVSRFRYPFAYSDPELVGAEEAVEYLVDKRLISLNHDPDIKYYDNMKAYVDSGLDYYDRSLVAYLCISRDISNQLGYIKRFEENHAFEKQGLICHWEHCIEHMPLPRLTREDHAAHLDFLTAQFERGAYDSRPTEVREELERRILQGIPDDAPETPDWDLLRSKCPIFGHCCPGGEEQVELCSNAS